MKRYTIKLDVTHSRAIIIDNISQKQFNGILGKYPRDGKDKYQVRFDSKAVGCENKGIVQVPRNKTTGKFDRIFETNLTQKRINACNEEDFN